MDLDNLKRNELKCYFAIRISLVWINSFKKSSCCSSVNYLNENVVLSCNVGKNVSMDTFISFQHYSNGTLKDLKEKENKFLYSSIDKSYYRSVRNLTIYNVTESDTNEYFCVVFRIDGIFSELAREKFILSNLIERKVWITSFKKTSCCSSVNYLNENVVLTCDIRKNVSMDTYIIFQHYSNGTLQDLKENSTKYFWSSVDNSKNRSVRNLTIYNITESDRNEYFCVVFGGSSLELAREKFVLSNIVKKTDSTANNPSSKTFVAIFVALFCFILLTVTVIRLLLNKKNKKRSKEEDSFEINFCYDVKKSNQYSDGNGPLEKLNLQNSYDVNICYAPEDRDWVINTLVPELERYGIKIFLNIRDDNPGKFVIESVVDAVSNSKHTIAVISPDFLKNNLCEKELQMALSRVVSHQVVPILYRPCPVPLIIKDKTYLEWCHEDVRPHFWKNLFKSLSKDDFLDLQTLNLKDI